MTDVLNEQSAAYARGWINRLDARAPLSTNKGSAELPFQRWFHFKEAYSPEFVRQAIVDCPYTVQSVLDPFGGSGTTAMTSRILGLDSVSIEVNPFLADLIRVKVTPTSASKFKALCDRIVDNTRIGLADYAPPAGAPDTLVEPGCNGRYVFARQAFAALRALLRGVTKAAPIERRLALVALGSIIVGCSNVVVNGKGRRYRRNWTDRKISAEDVIQRFEHAAERVAEDLLDFRCYSNSKHVVYNDDARLRIRQLQATDLVVFSPPYPNSFDYTDVYNLELWVLGYLGSRSENARLRRQTMRSHVQIKWPASNWIPRSNILKQTTVALRQSQDALWNLRIPDMIEAYFADLESIFRDLGTILDRGKRVTVAVGDSQYAGIRIDVAGILSEIVPPTGFIVENIAPIRSMRSSAQHGGRLELLESAVTFKRT
jgi:hypothetical protein